MQSVKGAYAPSAGLRLGLPAPPGPCGGMVMVVVMMMVMVMVMVHFCGIGAAGAGVASLREAYPPRPSESTAAAARVLIMEGLPVV